MFNEIPIDGRRLVSNFLTSVQIGDILKLQGNDFVYQGTIMDDPNLANLAPYIHVSQSSLDDLTSTVSGSVSVTFNAGAQVPLVAQGSMVIDFSQQNSAYYALKNVSYQQLDLIPIQDELNKFWSAKGFFDLIIRREMVLVTTVLFADSGTYAYSEHANSQVQLTASGNIPVTSIDLALSGGLNLSTTKGIVNGISFSNKGGYMFQGQIKLPLGWALIN